MSQARTVPELIERAHSEIRNALGTTLVKYVKDNNTQKAFDELLTKIKPLLNRAQDEKQFPPREFEEKETSGYAANWQKIQQEFDLLIDGSPEFESIIIIYRELAKNLHTIAYLHFLESEQQRFLIEAAAQLKPIEDAKPLTSETEYPISQARARIKDLEKELEFLKSVYQQASEGLENHHRSQNKYAFVTQSKKTLTEQVRTRIDIEKRTKLSEISAEGTEDPNLYSLTGLEKVLEDIKEEKRGERRVQKADRAVPLVEESKGVFERAAEDKSKFLERAKFARPNQNITQIFDKLLSPAGAVYSQTLDKLVESTKLLFDDELKQLTADFRQKNEYVALEQLRVKVQASVTPLKKSSRTTVPPCEHNVLQDVLATEPFLSFTSEIDTAKKEITKKSQELKVVTDARAKVLAEQSKKLARLKDHEKIESDSAYQDAIAAFPNVLSELGKVVKAEITRVQTAVEVECMLSAPYKNLERDITLLTTKNKSAQEADPKNAEELVQKYDALSPELNKVANGAVPLLNQILDQEKIALRAVFVDSMKKIHEDHKANLEMLESQIQVKMRPLLPKPTKKSIFTQAAEFISRYPKTFELLFWITIAAITLTAIVLTHGAALPGFLAALPEVLPWLAAKSAVAIGIATTIWSAAFGTAAFLLRKLASALWDVCKCCVPSKKTPEAAVLDDLSVRTLDPALKTARDDSETQAQPQTQAQPSSSASSTPRRFSSTAQTHVFISTSQADEKIQSSAESTVPGNTQITSGSSRALKLTPSLLARHQLPANQLSPYAQGSNYLHANKTKKSGPGVKRPHRTRAASIAPADDAHEQSSTVTVSVGQPK